MIELNKIHNMDCLEFMRTVPDKYFDLVLTDPPYGIGMDGGNIGGDNLGKAKEYKKRIGTKQHHLKKYLMRL